MTVYALIGYERYYTAPDNIIRLFEHEDEANRWCEWIGRAVRDAHFHTTYAELKQKYDWIPEYSSGQYDVVEHEVHGREVIFPDRENLAHITCPDCGSDIRSPAGGHTWTCHEAYGGCGAQFKPIDAFERVQHD